MKILFVAEAASLAHVARPLSLAKSLDPRDYEIVFACGERYSRFVSEAGFTCEPLYAIPGEEFVRRLSEGEPLFPLAQLRQYVRCELELLARVKPDLVVGDFRVSLGISSAIAEIPYVSLANAYWSPYSTQNFPVPNHPLVRLFGEKFCGLMQPLVLPAILAQHIKDFNTLRRERGLRPVQTLQEMYTLGNWTLYCDLPSLAPTAKRPATHQYLGPILWQPEIALPDWWDELGARDVVYVSSGSTSDPRLLDPVIDALASLPNVAVVAASSGHRTSVARDNVYTADYLPALQVLERAKLIVCNGGSGSIYQALSRGVPVLGLPSNADQHFAMDGVVAAGCGLIVRAEKVDARNVTAAAARLLEEPQYRTAASGLRREMDTHRAGERFNAFVRNIGETLVRPALVEDRL